MKILETYWFGGDQAIGIVATENDMGEIKFYIGAGNGFDEKSDSIKISEYGMKLYPKDIENFFKRHIK